MLPKYKDESTLKQASIRVSKRIILSFIMIFTVVSVEAQNYMPFPNEVISIESSKRLESIDNRINSFRVKVNYVKSDSSQFIQATEAGWFDMMSNSLESMFNEKRVIFLSELSKEFLAKEEFEFLTLEEQEVMLSDENTLIEK